MNRRPPRRVVAALAACALLLPACSVLFQERAPTTVGPGEPLECDASLSLPAADVAIAAVSSLVVAYEIGRAIGCTGGEDGCSSTTRASAFVDVLVPAAFAYSAWIGFRERRRCRHFQQQAVPLVPVPVACDAGPTPP